MSDTFSNFLKFRVRNSNNSVKTLCELKDLIQKDIESKEKKNCLKRIKVKLSRGLWESDQRLVEVIVNKNLNHFMISTINSIKYCKPFECLYLIENLCLEVLFNDIPLSIEESFQLLLRNQNEINYYRIFATLLRNGFVVKRHISPQICGSNSDRKRKLSDYDIDCNKHFELNTNFYELSSKIANYKCVKNVQQLDEKIKPLTSHSLTHFGDKTNYKDIQKSSVIYEIEDTDSPIELDPLLILFNGDIKPLCDLGCVYSNDQLFSLIQSVGPKTMNSNEDSESKLDLTLDVFKQSTKKVNSSPNFSVIVTKTDETVPQINYIKSLMKKSRSKPTYFAVLDSNDFVFYSINCCQLSDEFPVLWQKYLKPIGTDR